MKDKENGDDSLQPKDKPSIGVEPKQETPKSSKAGPEGATPSSPIAIEKPKAGGAVEQRVDADGSPLVIRGSQTANKRSGFICCCAICLKKAAKLSWRATFPAIEMALRVLRYRSRRDFLLFGTGALAALAGGAFLLPQDTLNRLGVRRNMDSPGKEWFLNKALHIDDDVAEALYSLNRRVPTYTKSQITALKNNYNGSTPDPSYIS
jgi:hypothetical protein